MPRAPIADYVRGPSGRTIPEATVVVSQGGTITAGTLTGGTATPVYSSTAGTAQVGSGGTLTADAMGRYSFYAEEGDYNRTFSSQRYGTWSESFAAVSGLSPGGRQLGEASIAVDFGGTSQAVTLVDVTGLTKTVEIVTTRPIVVEFSCLLQKQTNAGAILVYIYEGATQLAVGGGTGAINDFINGFCKVNLTPTLGSHTYKVMMALSTVGGKIVGASTSKALLEIVER